MDQITPSEGSHAETTGTAPVSSTVTSDSSSAAPETARTIDGHSTTLMGVLAYIGPLVLIPYFLAREDSFVKFHIRQGLVLLVLSAISWVLEEFMMWSLFAPLLAVINLILLILSIIGIVNVIQKKENPLPLVGGYAAHFKV